MQRHPEERIWDAVAIVLRYQNEMGIAPETPVEVKRATDRRRYLDCSFWGIGRKTAGRIPPDIKALQKNEVF